MTCTECIHSLSGHVCNYRLALHMYVIMAAQQVLPSHKLKLQREFGEIVTVTNIACYYVFYNIIENNRASRMTRLVSRNLFSLCHNEEGIFHR